MNSSYRHVLMVYPEFPKTFWGGQYTLELSEKKAAMPPLGLITIAAMTPAEYEIRLVDLNCEPLDDADLAWADMVCFSAMLPQKTSLFDAAVRCKNAGKLIVFGGPYPTACPEEVRPYCDILVLNEGEVTWPRFLEDLERGTHRPCYSSEEKPDVTTTPVPRFDLLRVGQYGTIPLQFSRGCPFQCEFCDIIVLFGRRPRTKAPAQFLAELEAVYDTGYRGMVFVVDDNFIGNKKEVKKLLPELKAWNEAHDHPFIYYTEASVNLAEDVPLIEDMVACDFKWVFLGIETPSQESLKETLKYQNTRRSLLESVRIIQSAGLLVSAGFIIGFDNDTQEIFERQIEFIAQAAIPVAMVGLLVALPGTPLYTRMAAAGRLEPLDHDRDQCGYTNIVTRVPRRELLQGYRWVIEAIYTPRAYFQRALGTLTRQPHPRSAAAWLRLLTSYARLARSILGSTTEHPVSRRAKIRRLRQTFRRLPAEYRRESGKFFWAVLRKCPDQLPRVLVQIAIGVHLYRFSFEHVLPDLDRRLASLPERDEAHDRTIASVT